MPVQETMSKFLRMGDYESHRYSLVAAFFQGMHGPILDVGCCEGGLRKYLSEGLEYHGLDGVECDFPNFSKADLNQITLPYSDGYFEAISCCATLEHLLYPLEVLREFKRILRPGGRILVSLPNDGGLNAKVGVFLKIKPYDQALYGHHWRFSIDTAREFFSKEFAIISEKPEFGPLYRKYLFWLQWDKLSTEWFMFGKKRP